MQLSTLYTKNRRAFLWLGGVVIVYVSVFHFLLPFLDSQRELEGEIRTVRQQVQRYLKALEDKPAYLNHFEEMKSMVTAYEGHFLESTDVTKATLQIEEIVRVLAVQSGIRVTRSNPLPSKNLDERFAKIGVKLNLEGDYDSLINFIHAVSSYERFLLIDDFQLTRMRVRKETRIQPRLSVSGFIRLS